MTSPAIEALAKSFHNEQLLLAGTEEFTKLNKSYLSCLESDLTPAAIFTPKNVDDVAKFVEVMGSFSTDGTVPFASMYRSRRTNLETEHSPLDSLRSLD